MITKKNKTNHCFSSQEEAVRAVVEETKALFNETQAAVDARMGQLGSDEASWSAAMGMLVHHRTMLRNKQTVLSYLRARMQMISAVRWDLGAVAPESISEAMSPSEKEFFTEYSGALAEYMRAVGVDVTSDLTPPKKLYVEVRVEKDVGEVMLDSGSVVVFAKGTTMFIRRSDAERWVRQGVLKEM